MSSRAQPEPTLDAYRPARMARCKSLESSETRWGTLAPELPRIDELNVELHPARRCVDACSAPRDWPLQAAKDQAGSREHTLGDCIAAAFNYVPAHGFEIFRAAPTRRTEHLAGLELCVRVRACPSADDVASGKILYAVLEEDATGLPCLALRREPGLRRKSEPVASLQLCKLEVVRIGERMVALVPLLVGRASSAEIKGCIKVMGFLSLEDDEAMAEFRALLVAGGQSHHCLTKPQSRV